MRPNVTSGGNGNRTFRKRRSTSINSSIVLLAKILPGFQCLGLIFGGGSRKYPIDVVHGTPRIWLRPATVSRDSESLV